MITGKNWLSIALRGTLFIYLPFLLMLYTLYNIAFTIDLIIHWVFILLYLLGFLRWLIDKYRHQTIEVDVQGFNGLDQLIEQGRWEVINRGDNKLLIRPTFDAPLNFVLSDKVELRYDSKKAVISGPKYYITMLAKTIRGEEVRWIRRGTAALKGLFFVLLAVVPLLSGSNIFWSYSVMRHNNRPASAVEIERPGDTISGNRPENTINHGQAVESDEYIFYVEDHLNLVRVSTKFEDKEYLIEEGEGYGLADLNIVEEWLYFTQGETLKRMQFDGTEETTLYSLGYLLDMSIQGNWIVFQSLEDDFSVYRMDINGRNLEKLLDVSGIGMTVHEERLIVSHEINDIPRVISYDLDGEDRREVLGEYARQLVVWEDAYYYIGEDLALYRSEMGETSEPQRLVDEDVHSFIPTDKGIFYTVHSDDHRFSSRGLYQINQDGSEDRLLSASDDVGGFSKVGESVLFSSADGHGLLQEKRVDLESGRIDVLD